MALKKLLVLKPLVTKDHRNNSLILNGDILYGEEISYNTGDLGFELYSIETRQWLGRFHKKNLDKLMEYFEEK